MTVFGAEITSNTSLKEKEEVRQVWQQSKSSREKLPVNRFCAA